MVVGVLAVLAASLLLGGCGVISGFGDKDPHPPTELVDLAPEITVATLWSRQVGVGMDRRLGLMPAIYGGRLHIADAEGRIFVLDAESGKILWEQETGLPFSGGPAVDAGHLVLGSNDGDLVAHSVSDGRVLWKAHLGSEILSVPRIAGPRVLVHIPDDSIHALDLDSGDPFWSSDYPAPVLTLRGSSRPVVTADSVIVGISGGKLVNLDLQDGLPRWEITVTPPHGRSELARIADIDADPILVAGVLYAATYNGNLAAVDVIKGTVLWRRRLSVHAGLAASSGVLYVTDSDDRVRAVAAADGTEIWQQAALEYRRLTAPAVLGNLVAVGDLEGYVHWLDRRNGRLVARVAVADGPITGRPQVAGDRLYVYGNDGTLAALSVGE